MKKDILKEAEYWYNFDRDLFYNRKAKKAFSLEFVDDHREEELREHIQEPTDGNGWKFYFNVAPSETVKQMLEQVLG
jgi:hypothetical protein